MSDVTCVNGIFVECCRKLMHRFGLRDLFVEAHAFIDADDGEAGLTVLEAMDAELMDGEWLALSYDDSTAISSSSTG